MKLPKQIPRATYRVQLHAGFNFDQLAQIIPYLDDLGISDLYLSPIFLATPGSTHGYDVCDHNRINDELGGMDGLMKVSGILRDRKMGILADFVPNHMGIQGSSNWRWMDVLEHGQLSRFSTFFDIKWNPRQAELQDRILLPLLHDFYGRVLDAGEIRLSYNNDAFWICYRSLRFPLRPESYGDILKRLAWFKNPGSASSQKLEKMAEQFRTLPKPVSTDSTETVQEHIHQRDVLRQELAALINTENLHDDLAQVLDVLNGNSENPDRFDSLHQILEEQNYRLAYWKTGTHEINYRRFFAIDTLVGLKMGSKTVFDESHQLLKSLLKQDVLRGVRVDHVDGLWDPAQYLERLSSLADGGENIFYSLVEKILTENEELPEGWNTHGTTGYDFIGGIINLLLASQAETDFSRIYGEFTGITMKPDEQAYRLKLYIMQDLFPNAIDNLILELEARIKSDRRWRDWTVSDLRPALAQIIACLSVYRTYRRVGEKPSQTDIDVIENAVSEALRLSHSSDTSPYFFIRDIWTGLYPDDKAGADLKAWADEWVCKLQQYTGAIMAKSIEDTFFYRYVRLFAANEVGHHPAEFGHPLADFHEKNLERAKIWPASMLGTSTHDTKMSEDVRARLLALSEIPEQWDAELHQWSKKNHQAKTLINDVLAPDANEEYLLYQILLGAWPLEGTVDETFRGRIKQFMRKALSESKKHTNWASPNEPWLNACDTFIDRILDRQASASFWDDFVPFAENLAFQGMKMSLVQVALKLTSPGIPDFYQGTELWDFSLVDPDNRRPVDYKLRQELLKSIGPSDIFQLFESWKDGRIKMYLIRTLLHHRREFPTLFSHGSYIPLKLTGPSAERFVSFVRQEGEKQLLVVALRRMDVNGVADLKTICHDTMLSIPKNSAIWRNLLTGRKVEWRSGDISLSEILDRLPISLFATS